jgi:hypothetical protein
MFSSKLLLKILTALATVILIVSCSDRETVKSETQSTDPHSIVLEVYKSPICGCSKWISHVDGNGFQSIVHSRRDTLLLKRKKGLNLAIVHAIRLFQKRDMSLKDIFIQNLFKKNYKINTQKMLSICQFQQ